MQLYDSVKKTKLPFQPIYEGKASIYVCGPTVYDDAHLGHARSSLTLTCFHVHFKRMAMK